MNERKIEYINLEKVRWRLGSLWFISCAIFALLLILQSATGVYGSKQQIVWTWALPNFLPTLSLMLGVFAADALVPDVDSKLVRVNFYRLSIYLSAFYLFILLSSVLLLPLISISDGQDNTTRITALQTSNLWLGPTQGLVVMALGVLFIMKQEKIQRQKQGEKGSKES